MKNDEGSARELEQALRFVHMMEAQGRGEQAVLAVETSALVDLLIAKGVISSRELDERKKAAAEAQRQRDGERIFPLLSRGGDKYQLASPDVPCAENMPICKGACCHLVFNLSAEDVEEGAVRWDLGRPYRIRQRAEDNKCVHHVEGRGCGVYEKRPGICRSYDCRNDKRIWQDYDKRILSPNLHKLMQPRDAAPEAPRPRLLPVVASGTNG